MVEMDEIVAELQREREKNAELLERIAALEAQLQHMINDNRQDNYPDNTEERISKRHKAELTDQKLGCTESQHDLPYMSQKGLKPGDTLVSWLSTEDREFRLSDKPIEGESVLRCEDTDDSDAENCMNVSDACTVNAKKREAVDVERNGIEVPSVSQNDWSSRGKMSANFRNFSLQKKPPKVAFCPKEAKRILNSNILSMKNAQSHTIRKIIVFASLGIRHGCDDMYELDYGHFSIIRKGEPFISQTNVGEHVLYDNPGVKRKVFYPNRDNTALCPVQILEEEQAMRPSDTSCPSCLFLCIKYGGQTRNIPQNEYVRQRMGRNKLKTFGPLICHMAGLVNVRTGSFFFKTLAITLLFMSGFSDDIVQRETKYRSLDLLQKYYRTDEDAAGEELFVTNISPTDLHFITELEKAKGKTTTKSKGKKKINRGDTNSQKAPQETPATQFGLIGYSPAYTLHAAGHQTLPSDKFTQVANCEIRHPHQPNIFYNHQPLYPMLQARYPPNAMMPTMYWPSPQNVFPPLPYHHASLYAFRPLAAMNWPHLYHNQGLETCSTVLAPKSAEVTARDSPHSDEASVNDSLKSLHVK